MSFLDRFRRPGASPLSTQEIADLIGSSPKALTAFVQAYSELEDAPTDNMFKINSRQAARQHRATGNYRDIGTRILAELEGPTDTPVTSAEVAALDRDHRPQFTGTMARRDIEDSGYPLVLSLLAQARELPPGRERTQRMLSMVAMLDFVDLDPVLYDMLGRNPASMGYWLPALERAAATTGFFHIPETRVVKVPLPILQMSRLEYAELTPATLDLIDEWARRAFDLDESREYFIKTGTYSSKFDFRNAHVHDPAEVREIGRYLTYIHYQANQMAGPLVKPAPMAGASTTNEWVVREWVPDDTGAPTIYHGLPLRCEVRFFIDCDTNEVLSVLPYWDAETMLNRFEKAEDSGSPDMLHDAVIYRSQMNRLADDFARHAPTIRAEVERILPALELPGQWSLDVMLNRDSLWLIDMAPAATSFFADRIPIGKLKPFEVDWLPRIGLSEHP